MAVRASDVTVLVGTFGDKEWIVRANRAVVSAYQLGCQVSLVHEETLARARTAALEPVDTPWVVYLDADDSLGPRYFMGSNDADVQPTKIRYIGKGMAHRSNYPRVAGHKHDCVPDCLVEGNYIHIGAIMRTELARKLTWEEWPVYEDYSWWIQAYQSGATFQNSPGVYHATVRWNSRNRGTNKRLRNETHYDIASKYFPERDWSYLLP